MKLINEKTEVLSNFDGDTQSFKIDSDDPFIFGVLRKSLYSDGYKAVCQEYLSNCRDSNREAGRAHIPVEVTINSSEGYIVFKDDGVGISPDRMENIFLWYGRSSKRDSNKYTGSYGLGAKTSFSIADSFTIKTKHGGICYEYCAFIDESSKGALKLISKRDMQSSELTGTEIRVPIGRDKCAIMAQHVRNIGQWWSPSIVLHGHPKIVNIKPTLYGNGWVMIDNSTRNSLNQVPVCISDGIPFYVAPPSSANIIIPCGVIPIFKTGDVQISANRETFYWSEITINKFKEHIDNFYKEYRTILEKDLNNLTEWHEKVLYLKSILQLFDQKMIQNIKYKDPVQLDISLLDHDTAGSMPSFEYKDGYIKRSFHPTYQINRVVKYIPGYEMGGLSSLNIYELAQNVKDGVFVINNDMVDQTKKETADQVETFKNIWEKYEQRLKDYTDGKRKSRPGRPSVYKSIPQGGILHNELNKKVQHYIKTNNISKNIVILTIDHSLIPIKYDINLSEINKIVLPVEKKEKKVKTVNQIPSIVSIYSNHRHYMNIYDFIKSNNVFVKFPRWDSINAFLKQSRISHTNIYATLTRLGYKLVLITDTEMKSVEKYLSHHKEKNNAVSLTEFIEEVFNKNHSLLYENINEYNTVVKNTFNNNFKSVIYQHGNHQVKNIINDMKEITTKNKIEIFGNSHSTDHVTKLRNNLDDFKNISDEIAKTLDKYPVKRYNTNDVVSKLQAITKHYPLLQYGQICKNSFNHWSDYIKMMNERKI